MDADEPRASAGEATAGRPAEIGGDVTHVVGIGASAGGLAALKAFFAALPGETGCAFVVIMHLSPEHESHLAELLRGEARMPVTAVTELVEIAPDHVYVISPNRRLVATDHTLDAAGFDEPHGQRMPIDHFFRSLADMHGDSSGGDGVGVILSGGGSDGSVGIKAVKEKGGLVMVQNPDEAEHDAMPRSAIATGLVDVTAPVEELARRVAEFARHPVRLTKQPDELDEAEGDLVQKILARLRVRTGHDFSGYKHSTALRRIQRRMQVNRMERLQDYLSLLRRDADEAHALFSDLLISVTSFFRDPASFEVLAKEVVPKLFEGKEAGDTVRVWSVGCSTGEEAYSVAMLLLEHAGTLDIRPHIQVFASDLGEEPLARAREGVYPHAIEADVPEERLRRFFTHEGDHYRVRRKLREAVLFAKHSVLRDSPFSRLDLIVCRNVLIYMKRFLQEKIFDVFHYALQPRGYLFLGNAETAESASDRFRTLSKDHRIYRVHERSGDVHLPRLPGAFARAEPVQAPPEATQHRRMLEDYAPPSLLVDEDYRVLHLSESAGRYLHHPGGSLTSDVTRLVRYELRLELRSALFRALDKGEATVARPMQVQFNGHPRLVYLTVRPRRPSDGTTEGAADASGRGRQEDAAERLALVIFNESDETAAPEKTAEDERGRASAPEAARLEEELERTRERLQATLEQHETSQEEMKASNEELQSVNEELETANRELESRLDELTKAHSDLKNLMESTEVGTLFLSRDLRIRRYTPIVGRHFNIMDSDRGRPATHLTHTLDYDALVQDAEEVLSELTVIEREMRDDEGRWHLMRIRPYRTVDDKIDGVVLTFVDITDLKEVEAQLRNAKVYAEHIVDTVREGLVVLDEDLRVESANASFYELFQVRPEETEGLLIYDLGDGQWDLPELRELLEEILPENEVMNDFEVAHGFETIGQRTMLLNARRLAKQQRILLAIEDISERKAAEEAQSETQYQTLFESMDEGFCIIKMLFDGDGQPVDYRFLEANPAFEEQTGLAHAEGKRMLELAPEHEKHWFEIYGSVASTGEPVRFERRAEALGRDYNVYAFRIGEPQERKVAILFDDITERKQTEEALHESKERLRRALAIETIGVIFFAPDGGGITDANDAFLEMSGYSREELQSGRVRLDDLTPPEWMPHFRQAMEEFEATGHTTPYEKEYLRKDGSCWRGLFATRRVDEDMGVKFVIDVTARAEAEEALHRLNETLEERVEERTEQVRALASKLTRAEHEERRRVSQILHDDLQQRLYGIQLKATFIRRNAESGERTQLIEHAEEAYEWIDTAIETARRLTVDLSPPVLESDGLADALGWLLTQMKEMHGLTVDLSVEQAFHFSDEGMQVLLFQMVRELLFNVVKHAETDRAVVELWEEDHHLLIRVIDEGVGFDVEAAKARQEHEGGFGLFSVRERLDLFGGEMEITSTPGQGTEVTIRASLAPDAVLPETDS